MKTNNKIKPVIIRKGIHNSALKIDSRGAIILYYSNNGERFEKSLGIKAEDRKKYEQFIFDKFNAFEKIISDYNHEFTEYPSKKDIEFRMNIINETNSISELFKKFLDYQKFNRSKLKSMNNLLYHLNNYENINGILNINKINQEFIDSFMAYLLNINKKYLTKYVIEKEERCIKSRKLDDNYIISLMYNLKRFLNYCGENGLIKKNKIDYKKIFEKINTEKYPEESFTREELDFLISKRNSFNIEKAIIFNCPYCKSRNLIEYYGRYNKPRYKCDDCGRKFQKILSEKTRLRQIALKKCLDLLLFQCFTSLRHSDSVRNMKDYIKDNYIKIKPIKTKKKKNEQIIPLIPLTIEILKEYDYDFKEVNRDRHTVNIKTLLKEFSEEMPSFKIMREEKYNSNGEEIINYVPRYLRFGSHSGRRTCITLMIEAGVPYTEGMKISGHTSIQIYEGYVNTRQINNDKNPINCIFTGEKFK